MELLLVQVKTEKSLISVFLLMNSSSDDMKTIKTMFTPLLKENSMKHIDYKTFNSIQTVANAAVESRYSSLQARVAGLGSDSWEEK